MKNNKTVWWIVGLVILIVGLIAWSRAWQGSDPDVITRNGLHWHPQLTMYVKGEKVEIPHNIGIGAVHEPMHTHEDLPLIHLEFQGVVKKQDLMLGNFFHIWGKDMQLFGTNTNMTMTVNGVPNTEYGDYMMRDHDILELRYE